MITHLISRDASLTELDFDSDVGSRTRCQSTLDQHVIKLLFSKRSTMRVSISNFSGTNVRANMIRQQKHHDFDFSYFYCSSLARQADWLTAISGTASVCSTNQQRRHRPASFDWHNVLMKMSESKGRTFMIVLDNVVENKNFLKMKRLLVEAVWRHRNYLKRSVKYLFIKRIESQTETFYE